MMMFIKYVIRYFTLFLLFSLLIFLTKRYGDFHTAVLVQLLFIPFLIILIVVNLIILHNYEKKQNNYITFRNSIVFLVLLLIGNFLYGKYESNKDVFITLEVEDNMLLTLYTNNKYRLRIQYPHGSSNYSGEYILQKNILTISDSLIETKSKKKISNKYIYQKDNNKFISTKDGYKVLQIPTE